MPLWLVAPRRSRRALMRALHMPGQQGVNRLASGPHLRFRLNLADPRDPTHPVRAALGVRKVAETREKRAMPVLV
jgi:hypothetical protein